MTTGLKIFLFAITALLVAIFVVIGVTSATEGQKMSNSGTTQVKDVAKDFSAVELTIYDGRPTSGSVVADLISKTLEEKPELAIWVKTNANKTTGAYYNKTMSTTSPYAFSTSPTPLPSMPTTVTSSDYINPDDQFMGKIYKDANDNIICIEFTQIN